MLRNFPASNIWAAILSLVFPTALLKVIKLSKFKVIFLFKILLFSLLMVVPSFVSVKPI